MLVEGIRLLAYKHRVNGVLQKTILEFSKKNGLSEKVLLLLDNAGAHPSLSEMKCRGIVVKFLPPKTTSLIQPMDQGVISSFKRFYRKNLLQEILIKCDREDTSLEILNKIIMKDIIGLRADAWQSAQSSTLRKAWCKFLGVTFIEDDGEENVPNLYRLFVKILGCNEVTVEDTEEWVTRDDN